MGGSIRVTSKIGKGSSFYLTAEFPLQTKGVSEWSVACACARVRILIIDDTSRGEVLCNNLGAANCDAVAKQSGCK